MDERYLNQMVGTRLHMGVEPFCLHCGYDMRGTPSGRCPECGAVFQRKNWERGVDEVLQKVNEADEAADRSDREEGEHRPLAFEIRDPDQAADAEECERRDRPADH